MAIVVASCSPGESKVRSAFKDYVQTDFDDPDDFMEIISVDSCDTAGIGDLTEPLAKFKHLYDSIRGAAIDINRKQASAFEGIGGRNADEDSYLRDAYDDYLRNYRNVIEDERQDNPNERYKKLMETKGNTLIQYRVKARVKVLGKPAIQVYYAICDPTLSTIRISKEEIQIGEIVDEATLQEIKELAYFYGLQAIPCSDIVKEGKSLYEEIEKEAPNTGAFLYSRDASSNSVW